MSSHLETEVRTRSKTPNVHTCLLVYVCGVTALHSCHLRIQMLRRTAGRALETSKAEFSFKALGDVFYALMGRRIYPPHCV